MILHIIFLRALSKAGAARKPARGSDPVGPIVRGADRARRATGVGPAFPIAGYDELNAAQVQTRIKELKKPELRRVLTYELKNANPQIGGEPAREVAELASN